MDSIIKINVKSYNYPMDNLKYEILAGIALVVTAVGGVFQLLLKGRTDALAVKQKADDDLLHTMVAGLKEQIIDLKGQLAYKNDENASLHRQLADYMTLTDQLHAIITAQEQQLKEYAITLVNVQAENRQLISKLEQKK